MKQKKSYLIVIGALIFIALIWYFSRPPDTGNQIILVSVKSGKFVISVTTTGELEARSNEKIQGPNPTGLRDARIWQYRIEKIVPDGTVVDSGQWVANLDRSDLENKIKDQELEVEKLHTQYTKTQLDTTMTLRDARDALINMKYSLEDKQIVVDQSIYEPPATRRQVKLELEKAERTYKQTKGNYILKTEKAKADMKEVEAGLNKSVRKLNELKKLKSEFVVYAPKAGMVIYKRNWNGKKQGVGAQISTWDNVVAILPDLSAMNSRTYVNEIDISKVKKGQKAIVSTDAFPDKKFTGVVTEVANMGQQMKNSNAKVFEVIIQLAGHDSVLRPSMTTKNRIITKTIDTAMFVPIECLHNNDSLSFVYMDHRKQQVITGKSNDEDIVIRHGLKKGDKIYLYPPKRAEDWKLRLLAK
ncbi:MAG TPA: HlyD family efflux transporter periplasmic adaptor subunit [Bacteroidetes bacterium]|nr:HlyD family efflux transporter periplasmic adaptor subunit [Bacteroidota bacterium]